MYVGGSLVVIRRGRDENMEPNKARYAQETDARTLADVCKDADVFLGCSAPGVLTADMVKTMGPQPLILALANPEPYTFTGTQTWIVGAGREDRKSTRLNSSH